LRLAHSEGNKESGAGRRRTDERHRVREREPRIVARAARTGTNGARYSKRPPPRMARWYSTSRLPIRRRPELDEPVPRTDGD